MPPKKGVDARDSSAPAKTKAKVQRSGSNSKLRAHSQQRPVVAKPVAPKSVVDEKSSEDEKAKEAKKGVAKAKKKPTKSSAQAGEELRREALLSQLLEDTSAGGGEVQSLWKKAAQSAVKAKRDGYGLPRNSCLLFPQEPVDESNTPRPEDNALAKWDQALAQQVLIAADDDDDDDGENGFDIEDVEDELFKSWHKRRKAPEAQTARARAESNGAVKESEADDLTQHTSAGRENMYHHRGWCVNPYPSVNSTNMQWSANVAGDVDATVKRRECALLEAAIADGKAWRRSATPPARLSETESHGPPSRIRRGLSKAFQPANRAYITECLHFDLTVRGDFDYEDAYQSRQRKDMYEGFVGLPTWYCSNRSKNKTYTGDKTEQHDTQAASSLEGARQAGNPQSKPAGTRVLERSASERSSRPRGQYYAHSDHYREAFTNDKLAGKDTWTQRQRTRKLMPQEPHNPLNAEAHHVERPQQKRHSPGKKANSAKTWEGMPLRTSAFELMPSAPTSTTRDAFDFRAAQASAAFEDSAGCANRARSWDRRDDQRRRHVAEPQSKKKPEGIKIAGLA